MRWLKSRNTLQGPVLLLQIKHAHTFSVLHFILSDILTMLLFFLPRGRYLLCDKTGSCSSDAGQTQTAGS